jgi:hypothetical protein
LAVERVECPTEEVIAAVQRSEGLRDVRLGDDDGTEGLEQIHEIGVDSGGVECECRKANAGINSLHVE